MKMIFFFPLDHIGNVDTVTDIHQFHLKLQVMVTEKFDWFFK